MHSAGATIPQVFKIIPPPSTDQAPNTAPAGQELVAHSDLVPDQYIVVYKDQWDGKITNAVAQQARQFINEQLSELGVGESAVKNRYEYALRGFTAKLTEGQLKALQQDPRVDYIEQDRTFRALSTDESSADNSGNSVMSGQIVPWGVSRVKGSLDGTAKKAWIIDSGIDLDHPDLNVDVANSASFIAEESADDIIGHGTYVAGLLAAKDNNSGIVGVAADADVVSVKVIAQNDSGAVSDVVAGVNYVSSLASTGDIINMSLGGPASTAIDDAVTNAANAGLRFAIAAGNEQQDAGNVSPARVEHSNVWTVSAYDDTDTFATSFSNFGNPPIEYSGPGVDIRSLLIGGGSGMGFGGPGTEDGTSYASPIIAGLLLASDYGIDTDGYVSNDPDNTADPIAVKAEPEPPTNDVFIYESPSGSGYISFSFKARTTDIYTTGSTSLSQLINDIINGINNDPNAEMTASGGGANRIVFESKTAGCSDHGSPVYIDPDYSVDPDGDMFSSYQPEMDGGDPCGN